MVLTDSGIGRIEAYADKEHNAPVMCQLLREVREIREGLKEIRKIARANEIDIGRVFAGLNKELNEILLGLHGLFEEEDE